MITGIHHVAISTANIDRLIGFYRDIIGFQLVSEHSWQKGTKRNDGIIGLKDTAARAAMLRGGNCFLEIFQFESPQGRPVDPNRPACDHGYTHFCLTVTGIDEEYERLKKAGVRFHCPPSAAENFGMRATYARDPDGNIFELLEILNNEHPFSMTRVALERA